MTTILHKLRDYACEQPSYTVAFAAWEMGVSNDAINKANAKLLEQGIVHQIEPRSGPYAAVYAYAPIPDQKVATPKERRRLFAELDDSKLAGVGVEAQPAGVVVPHTRIRGTTGSPGEDRRRQARGVRMARGKGK